MTAARAGGASGIDDLAAATRASASGGVSRASLRGLLLLSEAPSPRRLRASHLLAVCRPAPCV